MGGERRGILTAITTSNAYMHTRMLPERQIPPPPPPLHALVFQIL